jgi:glycosyltransferase involved in cell wall biosynthesis
MRILYHHRTLGDGAEGIHVREMVKAFRALGHDVKVIGPAGEHQPQESAKSRWLGAIKRALPAFVFEMLEIAYTAYAYWNTSREIRRFSPNFIYERYITFNAGTTLAARRHRVPVCLEVNAPLSLERSGEQDERLIFRGLARRIERWVCTNATHTVVVSTPLKTYLESNGVPSGKCVVMPNGVDPIRFSPREQDEALRSRLGIPTGHLIVGFTGVLRPWHGIDLLLSSLAGVIRQGYKVALLIVGDGPHRKPIEKMVEELGLQQAVFITGRVAHDRVPDYVSLFDVAVSPRATFYASPMKVIEYMALGKPVVVPRTPNFLDIVDEGVNGVTFTEADSTHDLVAALVRLCQSPQLCLSLGEQARRKVESRLNWRWNATEVCRLVVG